MSPIIETEKSGLLTPQEVAERKRRHPGTVLLALQDQSLHGTQRVKGGRWTIQEDCADAWHRGEQCAHHAEIVKQRRTLRIG